MGGDRLIEFEEHNYDLLVEKFLKIKNIRDLWEDFVYNEYEDSLAEEPPDANDEKRSYEEQEARNPKHPDDSCH